MQPTSLNKTPFDTAIPEGAAQRHSDQMLIERERQVARARAQSFHDLKLHNPLWDMIIELVDAHQTGEKLSVSDLCRASNAPESTALRYIALLVANGYAERYRDLVDLRRSWVSITEKGWRAFAEYARLTAER